MHGAIQKPQNPTVCWRSTVQLDPFLNRYGLGTARDALQRYATMTFEDLFPDSPDGHPNVDNSATSKTLDEVQDLVWRSNPATIVNIG